jgi:hypothetical protein
VFVTYPLSIHDVVFFFFFWWKKMIQWLKFTALCPQTQWESWFQRHFISRDEKSTCVGRGGRGAWGEGGDRGWTIHGWDIVWEVREGNARFLPDYKAVQQSLSTIMGKLPGFSSEDLTFSIPIHILNLITEIQVHSSFVACQLRENYRKSLSNQEITGCIW